MSTVPEESGRTRVELLRRSEAEWERKETALVAEIESLDDEIPELRKAQISRAPSQEPGYSSDTSLPRKVKVRGEKQRALANTRENLAAVRALIVEARDAEREGERGQFVAKAAEFNERELEAATSVASRFNALVGAWMELRDVVEERERFSVSITSDDERFAQQMRGLFHSIQTPFPASPARAFELMLEAGSGMRERRGGPLQELAMDLTDLRKAAVSRTAERSESVR